MLICFYGLLLIATWIQLNNRCCEYFLATGKFCFVLFSYKTDFSFKQLVVIFNMEK